MEKISVSDIVKFREKTTNSRITLMNNLKKPKKEKSSDGGNYWTTSLSTISNFYKSDNQELIIDKINDLLGRQEVATAKISKMMYDRNIEILYNFEDFDFTDFKPDFELTYIPKPVSKSILNINGVPIQVRPQHVFTYEENDVKKIGAIWLVSKLGGFKASEIGIFTEALYCYLNHNYSEEFEINSEFCIALDVVNLKVVNHFQILNKEIPPLLQSSLESIKKLL